MSIAIKRSFTIPSTSAIGASEIYVTSSVASTSFGTGALNVVGGVGIGGSLWTSNFYYSSISGVGLSAGLITGKLSGTATSAQVLSTTTDNSSTLYILGTRSNGGFAGTSIYVTTGISALGNTLTATTFSGNATTSTSAGTAGTATNAANANVVLDTTSTIYLTGSRSNSSIGSTPVYVLSGVSAIGNTLNASGVNITGSTASTSTTSGALIVTGGVGIGGSLWTSTTNFSSISGVGHLNGVVTSGVWSGTAISAVNGGTGLTTYSTGDIVYASSSTTLGKITAGSAGSVLTSAGAGSTPYWALAASTGVTTLNSLTSAQQYFSVGSSGNIFNISSSGSTHTFNIPIAGSGSTGLVTNLTQTIAGGKTFSSALNISDSTNSTSSSTGALIVTGGVGIGGTLTIGSDLRSPSFVTRKLTTVTLGATINNYVEFLTITGGLNGGYNLLISINNNLAGTNIQTNKIYAISGNYGASPDWKVVSPISEQASNSQSGAWELLILELQGNLVFRLRNKIGFVGTSTNSISIYNLDGNNTLTLTQSNTTGTDATAYTLSGGSPLMIIGANTQAGQGQVAIATPYAYSSNTALTVSGTTAITGSTASTSTSSGALIVTGGVGIGGSLWTSSTNFSSISGVGISNSVITSGVWSGTAISAVNGGTGNVSYTTGDILYASSSTTLGKIIAGTAGSVLTSAGSGSTPYWAVATAGSATGLTLNGLTATTQYFSTSISGSGFTIGSTGSTHTYYIGLAGNASTGLISGTAQTIFGLKTFASGIAITSGTASTNTTTGDLVVSGGVGIGDSLYVAGAISVNTGTSGLLLRKLVSGNYGAIYSTGITPSATNYSMITDGASVNFNGTNGVYFNINNTNKIQVTTNNINIVPTAGSSSTSTGAFTVAGGVGIGGSLWTSTDYYSSISGVGHSNGVITSGVWSGTAISAIKGGTGLVSYTTGDILYASSSTTLGSIAAGTAGSVLTSAGAGSTPYWAASIGSASGMTLNGLTATTQYFATSIAGSGFTIGSTGSTHTYYIALAGNASTGLISSAAQSIFGLKTFASGLAITVGTVSSNTTTGALTVAGGVGITGQLSVNTIALGTTAVSITPSMIFTGTAGTVITMSVLSDTTLAWEGTSGQLFSIDNNLSSGEIFSVSDISGLPMISASAGQTVTLNEFGGYTQVGNGLVSTSSTTGALRVVGGVGITGALNSAGNVSISSSTASTTTSTGALVVTGGVGIGGTLNIGADLSVSGLTTLTYTSEKLITKTSAGSAGTVTHDLSTGSVFYHSSISNNFTANITNVPTTNDRAIGVTLVLAQGVTAYMSTVLQIDGTTQTIKWVNNSTPTGTASKVDIVGFSLIRTGSAWTVLGQYSTYG